MKILIVSSAHKPTVNGVVTHLVSLRKDLEQAGHEVWILAPETKGYREVEKRTVRLASIRNPLNSDYPLAFGFFYPRALSRIKFDIIHLHHPFGLTQVALRAKKKSKAKLVFTNHTQYEKYTEYYAPALSGTLKRLIRHVLGRLYEKCDVVVCSTKDIKEYVKNICPEARIRVIPVGFDDASLIPSLGEGEVRRRFGLASDDFFVLYAGRIAEEKNIDFLIESVEKARLKNEKIKLVVAGGGDYLKKLKDKKLEFVSFAGSLPFSELASCYRDCDLFASASVTETLGLVFAEAAFCGAPLLGIDSDGVRDVIRDGENGLLAKNEDDFSEKLLVLSLNGADLSGFRRAARDSSLYFSATENSKRIEALYRELS